MRYNKCLLALLSITLYDFLMAVFKPNGLTFIKVAITLLPWLSFFISIHYLVSHYYQLKSRLNSYVYNLLIILFVVNFINIARGILDAGMSITTLMGSRYNALALLTPFAVGLGMIKLNAILINRFLVSVVIIGIVLLIISTGIYGMDRGRENMSAAVVLIYPVIFIIGFIPYQGRMIRYVIITVSVLLMGYVGWLSGSRTVLLRTLLLYLSKTFIDYDQWFIWFKIRLLLPVIFCTLLLPFYFIIEGSSSEQTIFQTGIESLQNSFGSDSSKNTLAKADTRTFLYAEVLDDLISNHKLLLGKGSNGTYYSVYFSENDGDSDTRETVEVGVLAYLLKGGLTAVIINLLLFYIAIYLAFFKSNNLYVTWVGFMLLIHTNILFIENLVSYDLYNFCIWFFVGMCLSNELRLMDNREIKECFNLDTQSYLNITSIRIST